MSIQTTKWMYQMDSEVENPGYVTVFRCPSCWQKSKVIADAHDDFICGCGKTLAFGHDDIGGYYRDEMKENVVEIVIKKLITVNGNKRIEYVYEGEPYANVLDVLRRIYKNQGELYENLFGVDRMDAHIADWHPGDDSFNTTCTGWVNFLKARGKIIKEEQRIHLSIEKIMQDMFDEAGGNDA